VNPYVDGVFMKDAVAVQSDKAQDGTINLRETLARAVLHWQVEEQMAVLNVRLPSALTLTRPRSREHDALSVQPLVQPLANLSEELTIRVVTDVR
jgi:hypothetical protein